MKKIFPVLLAFVPLAVCAETVTLGGTDYEVSTLSDVEIGPGIRHTRFRLPDYPLNINVLRVDLNNPYNRIETTVANESAKGTESLVNAAERQSYAGHRALAGANANFWVVSSQPEAIVYTGTTRNASVRNGVIVTESNQHRDQWDGGTMRTGVVSVSTDKVLNIDYCTSYIRATSAKFGTLEIHQSNKGVHTDELCMYNSFYGADRQFMPIKVVDGKYQHDEAGDATEVILDFADGNSWASNTDVNFIVREVRANAGKGTLGDHDLALVGRGDNAASLLLLQPGDEVSVSYGWIYNPGSDAETNPAVEQAVGGNAMVMRAGELTEHNQNEKYNSQVYSRTGYGCSADGKMLYIIVIDKSTDPVYGSSAGCNTAKMCEFARWLGCSNMANFDAGGSAEMLVEGRIENRTTEGTPRAVANGWLIYSVAPEEAADYNTITRLEFEDVRLEAPVYSTYEPKVIAYNRYGAVVDRDFKNFTLSCPPELGTCGGTVFTAAGSAATGELTATAGNVSVSKSMSVVDAQISLRVNPLLIDATREYTIEVTSMIGNTVYGYDPASFEWTVDNPAVASIDANGVIRGLSEGTSAYSCRVGDFVDNGSVTVEIAPSAQMPVSDWSAWTTKNSAGIKDVTLGADGTIGYTYNNPRSPSTGVAGEYVFYSLPDRIVLEFTSSVPVSSVAASCKSADMSRPENITMTPSEGESFAAGISHTLEIPYGQIADLSDIISFPLSIHGLTFKLARDNSYNGAQTLTINSLRSEYDHVASVEELQLDADSGIRLMPNPATPGSTVTVYAGGVTAVGVYTLAGVCIASVGSNGFDAVSFDAPLAAGVYIVRVTRATGTTATRLVVR